MSVVEMTKAGVVDDADPSAVAPAAGRKFTIPVWVNNEESGKVIVNFDILDAGGSTVDNAYATVSLWVKLSGVWTAIGSSKVITRGVRAIFTFGDLPGDCEATLRFESITGGGAASVKMYVQVEAGELHWPLDTQGIPKVSTTAAALPAGAATSAKQDTGNASLAAIEAAIEEKNTRDALHITEATIATLAYTKTGGSVLLDDSAPTDVTAVQATISQSSRPSSSVVAFVQLVDGGGAAVAGASCSIKAWLRITLPGGATYTYIDLGQRDGVTQNKLITWAFGAIRGSIELFFQVKNVSGSPTSIKVYAMPGADIPGAYDPATGSLRVGEVFQHGGEQNALGVHMISRRAHQSADGAPSWDDSATAEASSVIKAGPGSLYGFIVHNANGGTRWFQIYDSTTVPADGAVPKVSVAIPAGTTVVVNMPFERRWFATGMSWALSSTVATKTIAAADAYAQVAFA